MAERDTVPAPPVPSTNPTAAIRDALEMQVRERAVAVFELKPSVFVGLLVTRGVAARYTPELTEDVAHDWLVFARQAARAGLWIPEVCARCLSIKLTPSLCEKCLRKR